MSTGVASNGGLSYHVYMVHAGKSVHIACAIFALLCPCARAAALPAGEYPMDGHYEGVLPCSDCPGVWAEVTLVDNGPNLGNGSGTFVITQRFTGGKRGAATITTRGTWTTVDWVKDQDYTGTLELQPYPRDLPSAAPRYFYCDHGRTLEPLNDQRQPIAIPIGLQRVIPPPRREFGPLTEAASKMQVVGQVGDLFDVVLPAPPNDLMTSWSSWQMAKTTSASMALKENYGGSVFGLSGLYSIFVLKAAAPGKASVTFRSTKHPAQTATFSFRVEP